MEEVFLKLEKIIEMRQADNPENSYVAELCEKGDDFILKKIGEESAELIIASKNKSKNDILNECADVLFHVIKVLEERLGKSGIEEKETRSK